MDKPQNTPTEELTLSQRMRLAADTIDEANTRIGGPINGHWRPSELRAEADQLDAEHKRATELESLIEPFAREMYVARFPGADWSAACRTGGGAEYWLNVARVLIESGWRKDGAST